MSLPLSASVPLSAFIALVSMLLAWLGVPNEQAFPLRYPNVLFVISTGEPEASVVPVRYDGITLAPVNTSTLTGLYQHQLFFYHDRLDKFGLFEDRQNLRVWECTMFCGPPTLEEPSNLFLVHYSPPDDDKKARHEWYIVEMRTQDKETPRLLARTKARKNFDLHAPWVEPDKERTKPKPLPIEILCIWDILWPGIKEPNPFKWGMWLIWTVVCGAILWKWCRDDDDGF